MFSIQVTFAVARHKRVFQSLTSYTDRTRAIIAALFFFFILFFYLILIFLSVCLLFYYQLYDVQSQN